MDRSYPLKAEKSLKNKSLEHKESLKFTNRKISHIRTSIRKNSVISCGTKK